MPGSLPAQRGLWRGFVSPPGWAGRVGVPHVSVSVEVRTLVSLPKVLSSLLGPAVGSCVCREPHLPCCGVRGQRWASVAVLGLGALC